MNIWGMPKAFSGRTTYILKFFQKFVFLKLATSHTSRSHFFKNKVAQNGQKKWNFPEKMKSSTSNFGGDNFRVKLVSKKFLKLVTSKFMKIFEFFDFSKIHFRFLWSFHRLSGLSGLSDRNFCRIAKQIFLKKI